MAEHIAKFHACLRPGGTLWIADLVDHLRLPPVQELMWRRYGDYLAALDGPEYRDRVLAYVEREDTPRSLGFQLDLLRRGFSECGSAAQEQRICRLWSH